MAKVISHPAGASHFLCVCGEHLLMNIEARCQNPRLSAIVDLHQDRDGKYGSCPRCRQAHFVRFPANPRRP